MSKNDNDFERLHEAIQSSCMELKTPRETRLNTIKQYVGKHYSDGGSERVVPTNFLELATTIYLRLLSARPPRVVVSTEVFELRPFANDLETVLNQISGEVGLKQTLKRAVLEALFGIGVVKVGISPQGKKLHDEDYLEPFVDLVQLDDYFCDMTAKSWDDIQFEGNDYWMEKEDIEEVFGVSLESDAPSTIGATGDETAQSVGASVHDNVYRERVRIRDVYVYSSSRIITYALESKKILRNEYFDGPEGSPYVRLGFSDVPGNLMPLPPASLWRDMHDLGNNLFRKLANQATRRKSVAMFGGGNEAEIAAFQAAHDGDGIRYQGAKPEVISVGGVDQTTLAFYLQIRDLFTYFSGNLDSLGGLSPMSETVGQDKLLSEAANARMATMSEAVVDFTRNIFLRLAWYIWTDPVREVTIHRSLPGFPQISTSYKWTPETRDGDFLDYNIDIDIYSMQDDSPSTKVQKFGMIFERFLYPLLPMLQEQGASIDVKAIIDFLARHSDIPELSEFIRFEGMPMESKVQRGSETPSTMPAKPMVTTRRYERVNRPGGTRSGNDNILSRILLGENVNPDEAATLGRGVG